MKKDVQSSPLKVSPIEKVTKCPKKFVKGEKKSKKSTIPKRLKKMAHKPLHSPEISSIFSSSLNRKPQISQKGIESLNQKCKKIHITRIKTSL